MTETSAPTQTAHTPGPWEIASYQKRASGTCVIAGPAGMVAWVTDGLPKIGCHERSDYDAAEANARLMAAAPELLEALKACLHRLEEYGEIDHQPSTQARAAIKKAGG